MNKLINYLISCGKKELSEIIVLKTSKKLQKFSNKNIKKLISLHLVCFITVFKINNLVDNTKKKATIKRNFIWIKRKKARIFLALKTILKNLQIRKSNKFYIKLYLEIISTLENQTSIVSLKKNLQEQVFLKKHLLLYYRWR